MYLGLPISDIKVTKGQLNVVCVKSERRLGTWQGGLLSSRGKSILISSCLSNIPIYAMGMCMLYEGNYQKLDSTRSCFFWQGTNKKRKYHMVRWETLDRPQGFWRAWFLLDVSTMNSCLMCDKLRTNHLRKRDFSTQT